MPTPALEQILKERVAALVGDDLRSVEEAIRGELDSPVALIQEMGEYIAGAGGKRLRPMLLLLAARLAGAHGPRCVRLACVVELLHTATLIHDDVVDRAPLRRGRPSANARWGDDASVLVGRPPLLQVVRHARAGQRLGGHGNAGPGHGVDDRGRGVPAGAQAERGAHRGRLHPHHHPEDGVLHLRLLPHRRTPRGRRGHPGGGPHPLRPGRGGGLPDLRRCARLRGRPDAAGQGRRRRSARGQADPAPHRHAEALDPGRAGARVDAPCGARP